MTDREVTDHEAPRVVVVDDMREFDGLNALYLRTLGDAQRWLDGWLRAPWPVELWLDHDLGGYEGEDDVRPLVRRIEEHLRMVGPLPLAVRIVTDNPVGRVWMRSAFAGLISVSEDVPRWRITANDR